MSWILAIDQSTSATKAILFDPQGKIADKTSRDHKQIYPQASWVEHDANEIWENLQTVVRELCERNPEKLDEIVGLSIANQRETFVVFDRETGEPLHNAIVWLCRRGGPICEELRTKGGEKLVQERTGLKLDTYFPASKITWLLRNQPDVAEQVLFGKAVISTIDAYLIHRLTKGKVFATDHTNASRTLFYDVHKLSWDEELCKLFEVPKDSLPEIRDSNARFGETNIGGVLDSLVSICGVLGDSQASLFAQRAYALGAGKATFGTGTSVLINTGNEPNLSCKGAVCAVAWVLDGKPTYALEGIINYSSATIAWLKDQLELIDDPSESEALARTVEDNGGVYFVPAFSGLSAPHWNADARAAVLGMSGHTTKAHVVRAALEAISYQIHDVVDMIRMETGIAPYVMRADGGPTRNEFLMQFTADVTQLEWEVTDVAEASALGAAMAGMLGLELCSSLEELAQLPRNKKSYSPQMAVEDADHLRSQWQAAVQRVL